MRPGARLKWMRAGAGLYAMAETHVKAYPLMLKRLTENDFEVFDGHSAKRIDLDHKRTFFRDGAHLTNYGNSFVVREIGDLLLKKGWI